jgi:hypothetical protein
MSAHLRYELQPADKRLSAFQTLVLYLPSPDNASSAMDVKNSNSFPNSGSCRDRANNEHVSGIA